tara:strand:+ start:12152 stop:13372 length:1221 start_codon:yes stop_codon:yes gene_type:complete
LINKNILKGLFIYIAITYVIQLIGYLGGFYNEVWSTSDQFFLLAVDLFVIFILLLSLELFGFGREAFNILKKLKGILFLLKFKKSIVLLAFISGLLFYSLNLGNYRYTGTPISESFSWTLVLPLILKQFLYLFTFIEFYHKLNIKDSYLSQLEKAFIVFSQIFMITGVTSALTLAVTLLIFYMNFNRINILKLVLSFTLIPLFIIIGLYIKWSPSNYDEFIFSLENIELFPYVSYLVSRFSTTYYAHMHLLNQEMNIYNNIQNFSIILDNVLFRFNIILQKAFNIPKPEFASISQLNYESLAQFTTNDTSGSSPGIIPSFKYIFGNTFGSIFAAFYLNILLRSFLVNSKKPLAQLLIGILFFQSVFKAPMQVLLVFDLSFTGFICFLIAIIYINQESNKLKSCQTI